MSAPGRVRTQNIRTIDQRFEGPVANIKQQVKRNRKNEEARQRNKAVKSRIKTAIRRYRETLESGDTAAADERRREAGRLLDKAVSKGVIHKNQAANRKSAIAKRLSDMENA